MKGMGLGEVGQLRGRPWSMSRYTGLLICNGEYGQLAMIISYLKMVALIYFIVSEINVLIKFR